MLEPEADRAQSPVPVTVYGTRWCAETQMLRRHLDKLGILYDFRDMDEDKDAENQVRWWTGGDASHPTLRVGGEILVEPKNADVNIVLARHGFM